MGNLFSWSRVIPYMELLSDSEHDRLRKIRQTVAELRQQPVSWKHCTISMWLDDVEFLCRYIGELEHEVWSYYHG